METISLKIEQLKSERRRKERTMGILCLASLLVAAGVFWQLRVVGIALTDGSCCGLKEHVHTEECIAQRLLVCDVSESEVQPAEVGAAASAEEPVAPSQTLFAGGSSDAENICEKQEHIHDAGCFEEIQVLSCSDVHHTDACCSEEQVLTCETADEDHVHDSSCYICSSVLTCTEVHSHSEGCYETEQILTCTEEEHTHGDGCCSAGKAPADEAFEAPEEAGDGSAAEAAEEPAVRSHVHTDDCYELIYGCGSPEHTHTEACFVSTDADTETEEDWEATLPALTGDRAEDLVNIAKSQVGYCESEENVKYRKDGTARGYTRYGDWYGNPYADNWSAVFTAFCLHYAEIPAEKAPINSGCETMREEWAALGRYEEFYRPQKGDLVFFDKDEDGLADSVGIVSRMKTGSFIAIEGNVEDSVQETVYTFGDPAIMGFGLLPAEEEETGFGAMMLLSSGTPLSFANWINGVSLKYQRYGTGAWNDLQTGASVTPDDNLRFNINYTVPPNMLSEGNDTIYYDIPDVIRLVAGNSGSVKSQTGATMGNYVVLPTGRIEITFNEDNVAQNAGGHQITGFIAFDCAVSDIDGIEDGQTQVSIGGVTVNIPVEEEQHTPSGLNVDKRYTIVDPINGIVEFTVEVENSVKVEAPFVIEDHMNGDLRYYDGLQIKTPNGNDVTASFTIEDITNNPAVSGVSSSTKDFKLTKNSSVAADGKYIITYRAKLANPYNGDLRVTNRATASGKDVDGRPLSSDSRVNIDFHNDLLNKTGTARGDGSTVDWTITIDSEDNRIDGWELSDFLEDSEYTGNVTITHESGATRVTPLPYTFPSGSEGVFTVTYSTTSQQAIGTKGVKNTAVLTPPQGGSVSGSATVGTGTVYNPLDKTGDSLTLQGTDTVVNTWTVNIDTDVAAIDAPWGYEDTLLNGQYLSQAQQAALQTAVAQAMSGAGFGEDDYILTIESDGSGFTISSAAKGLDRGSLVQFSYASTGSVDISSLQTYRNKGAVTQGSKRVEATAELRFYPTVNKLDANASGDDRITEHEYYDVDGELCWLIQIQLPADTADAVTVTEALPAGITLQQLRMEIDGTSVASDFTWTGQQATCIAGSHTVTAAKSGQTVTVVLDPAFVSDYKSHRIDLLVGASVDDLPADGAVDVYTNTVTVTEGDQELGSCSQTQKITTNPYHEAITKTASTPDDNTVTYSLAINPQARDLLPGSDSLILTDELKYYNHANDPKLIMLQPGSLKVYERNADGTKGDELPSGTATYTYSTRSASNYSYNTLVITLPDEVAMIVEYTYLLSADSAGGVSLENTASLEGISGGDGQSANSIEAEIVDSVAGADLNGAIIYKHDSRDMGIGLEGAEFDLYKYDQNTNDYHEKVNTEPLVTDSTGMVTVSDLAYNLAYKLVETASPEGYIRDGSPYYFLLRDMRDQTVYKPSNFKGDELLDGALIYRPNVSENTSVTVEKQWQDENGNQVNKTGSIQFELWRTVQPAGAILPTKTLTVDLNKYSQPLYDFSGTYPQDTVLQFKVIEPNVYRKVPEGMTVPSGWSVYELDQIAPLSNMTKVTTYEQTGSGQSLYTFTTTFTITLDSDTMVEMAANKYFGDNKNQFGGTVVPVSVVSTPTPPETDDPYDEYVDTYTVAASNSWRCTVNDLPTKGTVSGEAVVYTYFVKEVGTVAGATPSYSNNSGITEGTIVITNTLSEEDSFVLPQTGGIGTTIFYALGGLLMAGAVILLVTKKKMSAEDDEA